MFVVEDNFRRFTVEHNAVAHFILSRKKMNKNPIVSHSFCILKLFLCCIELKLRRRRFVLKNNFRSSLILICLWVIISFMFTFFHFLKYFCWYWKWKFDCKIQSTVLQEWYRIFSKNWFRHIDNFVIYLCQVNWKIWRKNQIRDFKI